MSLYCHLLSLTSEIDSMIEIIFEVGINLLETFIIFDFLTKYLGSKYSGKTKKIGFVLAWLTAFAQLCIMNYITEFESVGAYIPIIINFLYAFLFLNGSILLKMWMSFITHVIVLIIAYLTIILVSNVLGCTPYDIISVFNTSRVVVVIISKIIFIYTTRIILRHKHNVTTNKMNMFMLVIIPSTSIIALACLMKVVLVDESFKLYISIGISCIVLANIMTYYFFMIINKEYERAFKLEIQKQQYEQQISSQSKHIDEILVMQKQIKKFRHDISHHFTALKGFFANQQIEDGLTYIEKINDSLEHTEIVDTGNTAFDAIISTKKALAESKNIEFTLQIQIPEKLKVDAVDLCVIFGNSLDNAIEGCEKLENQRMINVSAIYDDCQLICKITNTASLSTTDLHTTKDDKENHGFGLENIKQALSKYNHVMKIDQADNEFVLSFIIFNC